MTTCGTIGGVNPYEFAGDLFVLAIFAAIGAWLVFLGLI